jgi:hypothetical protein
MAHGIVDILEIIEIQEEHRQFGAASFDMGYGHLDPVMR